MCSTLEEETARKEQAEESANDNGDFEAAQFVREDISETEVEKISEMHVSRP